MKNPFINFRFALRLLLTRGRGTQNFLGAAWIPLLIRLAPASKREWLALYLLSLSPHYFFRDRYPARTKRGEFLKLERERNDRVRKRICERLLVPYLRPGDLVLDYGCGPGFLARSVSRYVGKVYAGDISPGTIACARIINPAPNLKYFVTGRNDKLLFSDSSLNLVYSFAVIQHLSDRLLWTLLEDIYRWLIPGGRAVLHIVVDDQGWKNEEEWKSDLSLSGRLRYRCGLHCFGRSGEAVMRMISETGFVGGQNLKISDRARIDDDVGKQNLFVFEKPGK